jgi:twitching motility protein PilT
MPQLLGEVVSRGASDLHLQVGQAPVLRLSGEMEPLEGPALTPEDTRALIGAIIPPHDLQKAENTGGADFAIAFGEDARFRVSVLRSKGNYGVVFRLIPSKFLSMEQIGLPPMIKDLLTRPRGLILVTGPTGSGKSTTLASMVNWINELYDRHIVTVEDPIEYYHYHKKSVVNQREVGRDTASLKVALKNALRQAPDVILIGEIRDRESMEYAITFAGTGHLCLATLHANNAPEALDRIINMFPRDQHSQIFLDLSQYLKAILSQRLVVAKNGRRCAAIEVLLNTPHVQELIKKGDVIGVKESPVRVMLRARSCRPRR